MNTLFARSALATLAGCIAWVALPPALSAQVNPAYRTGGARASESDDDAEADASEPPDPPEDPPAADADPPEDPPAPPPNPPDPPDISPEDQRAATGVWRAIARAVRPTYGGAARSAILGRVRAFRARFPGAAEVSAAIGVEARALASELSPRLAPDRLRAVVTAIDALADCPGASVSDVAEAFDDAFMRRFSPTPAVPLDLLRRIVERYGEDRVSEVASRYDRARASEERRVLLATNPEARRRDAERRSAHARCIAECMQEPDTCSGWVQRRRLVLSRGRPMILTTRRRYRTACSPSLETCRDVCGDDESE